MDILALRYFVAVSEAGSISRAAVRCKVSQPTISQQIKQLEDTLGVKLFDRLGRGVALTDAGRALLPRASALIEQMHEIETAMRSDLESGRGRLAVGAIPTMAPYLLPAPIAELRRRFPECELEVREDLTENLVEALVDGELDLAVMSTPIDHPLINLRVIARETLVVVAPADSPLCETDFISLADLRQQATVTLHEMHCLGRQISEFCAAKRIAGSVSCRMTQIGTLLEFVRLGLGVSIVPELVARRDTAKDRRYLPFRRGGPAREIALATRRGRSTGALADAFSASVATHLSRELSR